METPKDEQAPKKKGCGCLAVGFLFIAVLIFLGVFLGPVNPSRGPGRESSGMQTTRAIDLAMFEYAQDHNGSYPEGKTSTEVFQKLIDEQYVSDPAIFYISMPGKTRPTSNKLAAENVSYDVTGGITSKSPDDLPVVFTTGYSVTYTAGATAIREQSMESPFRNDGMAVAYKNNSAAFKKSSENGDVPLFIPDTFNPGNETYTQLKP